MEFWQTRIDLNLCFQAFQIFMRKNFEVREHLSRIALDNEKNKPGGVYIPLFDKDFPHVHTHPGTVWKEARWITDSEIVKKCGRKYRGRKKLLKICKRKNYSMLWQIANQDELKRLDEEQVGCQFLLVTITDKSMNESKKNQCMCLEFALHSPIAGYYCHQFIAKHMKDSELYDMLGGERIDAMVSLEHEMRARTLPQAVLDFDGSAEAESCFRTSHIKVAEAEIPDIKKKGKYRKCANPMCERGEFNSHMRKRIKKASSVVWGDNNSSQFGYIHKKNLLLCNRCKKVYYCSRECQKKMWKSHKPYCIAPGEKKKTVHFKPKPNIPPGSFDVDAASATDLSRFLEAFGEKPISKKKKDLVKQMEKLDLIVRPTREEYIEEAKRQRREAILDYMLHGRPETLESEYERNLYDHWEKKFGPGARIPKSIYECRDAEIENMTSGLCDQPREIESETKNRDEGVQMYKTSKDTPNAFDDDGSAEPKFSEFAEAWSSLLGLQRSDVDLAESSI